MKGSGVDVVIHSLTHSFTRTQKLFFCILTLRMSLVSHLHTLRHSDSIVSSLLLFHTVARFLSGSFNLPLTQRQPLSFSPLRLPRSFHPHSASSPAFSLTDYITLSFTQSQFYAPPLVLPLRHAPPPLSATYRWWAHLCGCLSHLTTHLGGQQSAAEKTWTGKTRTKHSVDVNDIITEPSWACEARDDSIRHPPA